MSDRGILVVVPCLNEAAHLEGLLVRLRNDPGVGAGLIVVADGGSRDSSRQIVEAQGRLDPRVRLYPNPKKIQSAGVNGAVAAFGDGFDYVVRVDAHAGYPDDYCQRLVEAAEETGAASVVVSMRAVAQSGGCFQIAAATVQNSALGAGGSAHRSAGERRWIDHGHHALFRTARFKAVGGYDEAFSHNEDAELDARLAQAGGRILLAGDLLIDYFPRSHPRPLFRQYYSFGRGRAQTLKRHRMRMKPRQAAPTIVAPAVIAAIAGLVFIPLGAPAAAVLIAAPAVAWLAACLSFGALLGLKRGGGCAVLAGVPAAIIHFAWSLGFWSAYLRPVPDARLGLPIVPA